MPKIVLAKTILNTRKLILNSVNMNKETIEKNKDDLELLENLKKMLRKFKEKYKGQITIEEGTLNLNSCFKNQETGKYQAPQSYGDLNKKQVKCYVTYGEPFINKYKRDKNGKLTYKNGSFVIREKTNDFKVLTCLCNKRMKNTSLHEIYDALSKSKNTVEIQGFRNWNLRNVLNKIKENYPDFKIERDTAFIFSGKKEKLDSKIKLNKLWLNQITNKGAGTLETMTNTEKTLIKEVYTKEDFSEPKKAGYMYGKKHHVPESGLFLKKKFKNLD